MSNWRPALTDREDCPDLPTENSSEATPQFTEEERHGLSAASAQDIGGAHAGSSPELLSPPHHTHEGREQPPPSSWSREQ